MDAGCINKLIGLTTSGHMELAIAATAAIAMITTVAAGKEALLDTGEVLLFLELLDWRNLALERNVLSIVANTAENPKMRALWKVCTECGVLMQVLVASWTRHLGKLMYLNCRNTG